MFLSFVAIIRLRFFLRFMDNNDINWKSPNDDGSELTSDYSSFIALNVVLIRSINLTKP